MLDTLYKSKSNELVASSATMVSFLGTLVSAGLFVTGVLSQDNLGLSSGYITLATKNFNLQLVKNAQVLASLKPAGDTFDFLPLDYLSLRARNGQYHWGDITYRYRQSGTTAWINGDSAAARQPVTTVAPATGILASSRLGPTLPSGSPLNITREWLDVSGDLGLRFTLQNSGSSAIEIGSLGFPAEFNSIFTNRYAADMQRVCSLSDPYVGMHAGQIRVAPTRGTGAALVVSPLGDTPLEAYRNLAERSYEGTYYGSQTFEGFYEWQVLTKAWAENEWRSQTPWNVPTSRTLQPGQSLQFGVRFSVAKGGVRELDATVRGTGTPTAVGVPGYIIPRGEPAQLFLQYAQSTVQSIASEPAGALTVTLVSAGKYTVTPSTTAWGRVRLTVTYADGKLQTIHYYVTKPSTEAVASLGKFLTTAQYFTDTSDPFGRAPSVMTYDYETKSIVTQDSRAWVAGLSDEAGAGSYLSAFMKQAVQPNADEVTKLEAFVDRVLWKTIQTTDFAVRKAIFFYEPAAVPGYAYSSAIDWTSWTSWNKAAAYSIDRAYNYVHVAGAYWSLYRVGRAYPALLKTHAWDWYLNQAYETVMRAMKGDVGYNRVGLMGETVFGEILADLGREGQTTKANALSAAMKSRAAQWDTEEVPFGSEMAWDSTGQEGVYYWAKYFGYTNTATKSVNSVLGFMPTVPHWGWNGNARRYWDNIYGGKLRRIERQIHHYGSGLNALVLLSAFRSSPTDTYLLRTGYGGTTGPLSNINQDGFAAASFHSWPDTLKWDGISGDYGPNFLGLALGSGTYVVQDSELGVLAFGGVVTASTGTVSVTTKDAVRRKVFIGPLGVLVSVDAGIIQDFAFTASSKSISVTLAQLDGVPKAASAVVWLESTTGTGTFKVTTSGIAQARGGWSVPLSGSSVTVQIGPA
ncbi:putative glycoside hydrolase family 43 protein [Colletotrichum scovillei]|uniref:Glycoside hydrolase family 43 protein n=2 Tax=Colletotrichum scovillei TaxID=1209932 RepID=A0A9P7R8F5_9PEZI|nr:putative glycoside hydrolase family 43 protein [Colletotrichum scovillei]KAG7071140.1 putative glycoside hydrolase family 43 protein [Colletotrichum scovillei]KAG7079414.1 putative glycoside hydrolase family 43 protein [Colletotrichum scovillei]